MTLYQLGDEYLRQADILKKLVKGFIAQKEQLSGVRLAELNHRITVLRNMEQEMRITGNKLRSYYDSESDRKHYVCHNKNNFQ